jgi:hypothetical protein
MRLGAKHDSNLANRKLTFVPFLVHFYNPFDCIIDILVISK